MILRLRDFVRITGLQLAHKLPLIDANLNKQEQLQSIGLNKEVECQLLPNALDFVNCTIHNRTGTGTPLNVFRRCTVDAKNTIIFDYSNSITNVTTSDATINLSGPCNIIRDDDTSMVTDANNIAQDPQFIDQASGDLRLRPSSPCIDAGTN